MNSNEKYYSADLSISIVEIRAESKQQAQEIVQRFVDEIATLKCDLISWDEADWTIHENVLDETEGVWDNE